jgi:hypothetical protein
MNFHPTPEMVAQAYEYLRASPPFNKKGLLPHSDSVVFQVTKHKNLGAEFSYLDGVPCIAISLHAVGRTHSLIEHVAHEMVHFALDRRGIKTDHGTPFKKLAKRVCDYHGFDLKQF